MRVDEASPQLKISGLNNCVMYHRVSLKNPSPKSVSRMRSGRAGVGGSFCWMSQTFCLISQAMTKHCETVSEELNERLLLSRKGEYFGKTQKAI